MKNRNYLRILSCILAVLMLISMVPVMGVSAATTEVAEVGSTYNVYFDNSLGWSVIYAYCFGGSAGEELGSWPGTRCTNIGNNIWSIDLYSEPECVIFHANDDINQTSDIPFAGDDMIAKLTGEYTAGEYKEVAVAKFVPFSSNDSGAETGSYQGLEYLIIDGEVTIAAYMGSATEIIIPSTIDACPVVAIENNAFNGCSSIQSVTIPEGVTSIGNKAFYNCKNLRNVTIPESVTSIGDYAFYNCRYLQSVTIPEGVTSIGNYAFYDCYNLQSVTIPEGVTSIGDYAFNNCDSLQSVTIPEGVTSIGNYAFYSCESLLSVTIPEGVTSIGDSAFRYCSSLQSVTIPEGVTSIGNYAFDYCYNLRNVTISEGVTSIGDYVFYYCYNLQSVTIPESVTRIGNYAFDYCSNLSDVYYGGTPEQWTTIAIYSGNLYLTRANIIFSPDKLVYSVIGNEVTITGYEGDYSSNIYIPAMIEGYPVTAIASGAFTGADMIRISIPSSVTTIEDYAFEAENGHICYDSTIEKWKNINIGEGNDVLFEGTRHYNTDYKTYSCVVTTPTCQERGYTACTCKYCSDSYKTDYTDIVDHKYTATKTVDRTCTAQGYTLYECAYNCGASYKDNYVDIIDHYVVDGYCTGCKQPFNVVESPHDYLSNTDKTWTIYEANAEYIDLTFSEKTNTEKNYDVIYIYDGEDNQIGKYSGVALASQTIRVEGDTAKIRFVSDESGNYYGFRAEYYAYVDDTSATTDETEPSTTVPETTEPEAETMTIYFTNNLMWKNAMIYYWGVESTAWPGVAMTYVETNELGKDIYSYTIPRETDGVVFNSGDNLYQTVDVIPEDGMGYYCIDSDSSYEYQVESYEYIITTPETTDPSTDVTVDETEPDTTVPKQVYGVSWNEGEFTVDAPATIDEGTDLTFTVEAAEGYRISAVICDMNVVIPVDGVYTIPAVSGDIRLFVVAEVKTFDVTFVGIDGETVLDTQTVEYGKAATAPEPPEVKGYEFKGWSKEFDNVTKNITVKANYKKVFVNRPLPSTGKLRIELVGGNKFTIAVNDGVARPQGASYMNTKMPVDSKVTVVADTSGNNFIGWMNESGAIVSTTDTYTFVSTGNDYLKAVYQSIIEGVNVVTFKNAKAAGGNGQILDMQYYAKGDVIEFPDAPSQAGYDFAGWSMTADDIQAALEAGQNVTVVANWEFAKVYIDVNVTGGEVISGLQPNGQCFAYAAVTVSAFEAPAGQKFAYWKNAHGEVMSYDATYKFYSATNIELIAVYVAEEEIINKQPMVFISADPTAETTERINYMMTWDVDESIGTVKTVGIMVVDKDDYDEDTFYYGSGDTKVFERTVTSAYVKQKNTFSVLKGSSLYGHTYVATMFVVYKDAVTGENVTIYAEPVEIYKQAP